MNITPSALEAQYLRALSAWPFLAATEEKHGLPRCLLFAIGSRETNLQNEVGDGGHGHGVWQLDDRSHTIPSGFDADVQAQAEFAAGMLKGLLAETGGNLDAACDLYNSGSRLDSATTGHDYGPDVLGRLAYLQGRFPAVAATSTEGPKVMPDLNPPWQIVSLCAFEHPTLGPAAAAVASDGAVACDPANAYLGGANGKQFFTGRTAAKIDAQPGGYVITDTAGETYAFPTNDV